MPVILTRSGTVTDTELAPEELVPSDPSEAACARVGRSRAQIAAKDTFFIEVFIVISPELPST
jgi:hypothetical protein